MLSWKSIGISSAEYRGLSAARAMRTACALSVYQVQPLSVEQVRAYRHIGCKSSVERVQDAPLSH